VRADGQINASRIVPDCRQRAAGAIDAIGNECIGQLADCEQVFAVRIDAEAARLLLRRHIADAGQPPRRRIDPEAGQRAGAGEWRTDHFWNYRSTGTPFVE
jgi:hypothetical protein